MRNIDFDKNLNPNRYLINTKGRTPFKGIPLIPLINMENL